MVAVIPRLFEEMAFATQSIGEKTVVGGGFKNRIGDLRNKVGVINYNIDAVFFPFPIETVNIVFASTIITCKASEP